MKIFLFVVLSLISVCFGFTHHEPDSCTVNDLPPGANSGNTYDYIFVGSGGTSTTTIAKLVRDLECDVSVLVIEAGRSYSGDPEPECGSPFDCYVRHTENKYHQYGSGFVASVVNTRGTWSFVTREQPFTPTISYSDGRDNSECPPEMDDGLLPPYCPCTSEATMALSPNLCQVTTECLANNGGNTNVCGELVCSPEICAKNGTNLYYRATAKGGSNAHHAMVSYKMSPYVAGKWVEATGDPRFSWNNWERALEEWTATGGNGLRFVNAPSHPLGTSVNDTFKALFREAAISLGQVDLTRDNQPKNAAEFFDQNNPDQPYFKGFVTDTVIGRQIGSNNQRSFPDEFLQTVMQECPSSIDMKCGAFGTNILFNDNGQKLSRQAIGVEYVDGSNNFGLDWNFDEATTANRLLNLKKKAYARRGVILGGGVMNTPQILMLSGIGDETQLGNFDIPVRKHLPAVGQNFVDDTENSIHYILKGDGDPFAANSPLYADFANKDAFVPDIFKAFFGFNPDNFNNFGAPIEFSQVPTDTMCHSLAGPHGGRTCPTIPNTNTTIMDDPAYLARVKDEISFYNDAVLAGRVSIVTMFRDEVEKMQRKNPSCLGLCFPGAMQSGWYDLRFSPGNAERGPGLFCDVLVSDLKSRGSVTLSSANPFDPVIVDPNTHSVPSDIVEVGKCVNKMRSIINKMNELSAANPSTYANLNATEFSRPPFAPGPSVSTTQFTPELEEFIKTSNWHHHPSGTDRMGHIHDDNSVVDSRGRVWGTQNLYVIDVSTFAHPVDVFPSNNAIALGWLQAESLVAHHHQINPVCSASRYMGPQLSDDYDANPPYRTWVIILGIAAGVLLVIVIIMIVLYIIRGSTRAGGYTKLNSKMPSSSVSTGHLEMFGGGGSKKKKKRRA